MSTQNLKLKINLLTFLLFCSSFAICQIKFPDTLVVNSKPGKIILISDSILKFKTADVQSIINKAINKVRDSLIVIDTTLKMRPRLPKDSLYSKILKNKQIFVLQLKGGGAYAAGRFSSELGFGIDFAPQRQSFYFKRSPFPGDYTFINLSFSSLMFFEKPINGPSEIFRNYFVEGSFGNRNNNSRANGVRLVDEFSFGVGYLVNQQGNYFGRNTTKVFLTIVPKNSFVGFKPELYLTNNFKTSYLGLSFRFITPFSKLFKP